MSEPPRLYLDHCSLNRLFDEQSQERVQLETAAVSKLLVQHFNLQCKLLASPAHEQELLNCTDVEIRVGLGELLLRLHPAEGDLRQVRATGKKLELEGIGPYDALHVAFAYHSSAEAFLTCDDGIVRKKGKIQEICPGLLIENVARWLQHTERLAGDEHSS